MAKHLVIVESPAKAKTIEKYLGKDYTVLASVGHIMDLPESELGVDIENEFTPNYTMIRGKKKVIDELKRAAAAADSVYLAPDPDREGEAIAWHIAELIKGKNRQLSRIQFNEITKKGVEAGISNPGPINENRVNAQQSRRILDRLVGYLVSPLLWKPLKYGLSAGRVQSVALRLICERESEIEAFVPKESWTLDVVLEVTDTAGNTTGQLIARLEKKNGEKFEMPDEATADAVLAEVQAGRFAIDEIVRKEVKRSAPVPFITSQLQQDAIRKLGFTAKRAMSVAQQLYEGIELGKEGPVGLITYMRTDSIRISEEAASEAKGFITKEYGKEFLPKYQKQSKQKGNVQDAHEAIRPTSVKRKPDEVRKFLSDDQYKLYKLIWERFVASQMADAIYDQTVITVLNGIYLFKATGRVLKFAGYMSVYIEPEDDKKGEEEGLLASVTEESGLNPLDFPKKQHFTTPPPRYTEASLVRAMEQQGIGRPSTYASIISTIVEREYVELKERKFHPTELGRIVVKLLVANFPKIFEIKFTAHMEEDLDRIEEGNAEWKTVLKDFYSDFSQELNAAGTQFTVDLTLENSCPSCGGQLNIKYGKKGSFVACTKYPECSFTSDYTRLENGAVELVAPKAAELAGADCEKCGKPMVFKKTRFGEVIACPGYPECKNLKNFIRKADGTARIIEPGEETGEPCPDCGSALKVKAGRNGLFIACSNYPTCKLTANLAMDENGNIVRKPAKELPQVDATCDKCGKPMAVKRGPRGPFLACTGYPGCKNTARLPKGDGQAEEAKPKEEMPQIDATCDKCGAPMAVKRGPRGLFAACTKYPKCKNAKSLKSITGGEGE